MTTDWTDAVTSIAGAANVAGLIRNASPVQFEVIKGGASAPAPTDRGVPVNPGGAEYCVTDHIWLRGPTGAAAIFETMS
ncbi:MAG TPA: hypothetical protein VF503_01395 [Sphingobium sp.]|uniref:hypothetical protein n=1 Tax=Sphingobium sp. TaxID=1912891 RepID=UPI002ED32431